MCSNSMHSQWFLGFETLWTESTLVICHIWKIYTKKSLYHSIENSWNHLNNWKKSSLLYTNWMVHTVIQHSNCMSSYTTVDSIKHEWIVDWLVLWSLTSLSTIFQVYRGCHFHWWRKPEYQEKTTDLPQVIDKLYQIMLYTSPWFDLTSVVIGTDCIGRCKSNYHTIMTTAVPWMDSLLYVLYM